MASFEVTGFISAVKYQPDTVMVFIDEFKRGYKKQSGEIVDDKYHSWKIIYKPYFKKYISEHFNNGMLVKVKGEVMPYAIERNEIVDGYSVIGETINLASYPRSSVRREIRMMKESQENSTEAPNLEAYNQPDF